jgi:zinc protease
MTRLALRALPLLLLAGCSWLHPTPAWELPPPRVPDEPVVDEARLVRRDLPNGLRVLILEDRRLPRFEIGVIARRGAGLEAPEQAGLASLTAEMMERGAGERDALELAAVVDALGASLSVEADWDSVTARVAGLSQDLDTLLAVLADVTLRPRFDADETARVRAERRAALERAKDDPSTLVSWHFQRLLYDGHRYGAPLMGTPEAVGRLEAGDARAFHAQVFTPADAVVFATGDVSAAELLPRLEGAFGAWQGPPPPPLGPPPPATAPDARRVLVVDRPDLGQAQIAVGHEGIERTEPRRIEVSVLNTALGAGGFSSRLMEIVRTEEGLTYSIGSIFDQRHHAGPFAVRTFTRVPETRRVLDLVLAELERMRREPPDADELVKAQSQLAGSFGLALETSSAVVSALAALDVYGLPEDSLDTYRGRIRAVSVDQVADAARALIHPDRAGIVVVGPAAEITPQLEGLGPVEVVAP